MSNKPKSLKATEKATEKATPEKESGSYNPTDSELAADILALSETRPALMEHARSIRAALEAVNELARLETSHYRAEMDEDAAAAAALAEPRRAALAETLRAYEDMTRPVLDDLEAEDVPTAQALRKVADAVADKVRKYLPTTALAVAQEGTLPAALARSADAAMQRVAEACGLSKLPDTLTEEWAEAEAEKLLAVAAGTGAIAAGTRTAGTLAQGLRILAAYSNAELAPADREARIKSLADWLEDSVSRLFRNIKPEQVRAARRVVETGYRAMIPVAELRATWNRLLESGDTYPENARELMRNLRKNTHSNPSSSREFVAAHKDGGWKNALFSAPDPDKPKEKRAAQTTKDKALAAVESANKAMKLDLPASVKNALADILKHLHGDSATRKTAEREVKATAQFLNTGKRPKPAPATLAEAEAE